MPDDKPPAAAPAPAEPPKAEPPRADGPPPPKLDVKNLYISYTDRKGNTVQAVQDVASGRSILDPDATNRVLRMLRGGGGSEHGADLSTLSAQERRVLALVAEGLTNKQVGEQLSLSENTVKNYLVNVFEKLQVKRRAQAAAIYVQQAGPPKQ